MVEYILKNHFFAFSMVAGQLL